MINLGFGGKLIHGGTDRVRFYRLFQLQSKVRAKGIAQALGDDKSTHGGYGLFDNHAATVYAAAFIDIFKTRMTRL